MTRTHPALFIVVTALFAHAAFAEEDATPKASEPELDTPTPAPSTSTLTSTPTPTTPAPVEDEKPVASPAHATATPTVTTSGETLAEKGGLFGVGLVVAPKVGGSLGSILLPGTGADLTASLELGYTLPLPHPIGRDIEVFADVGYAGPSTQQTIAANDARLPTGSFHYTLTEHELGVTWGALYRVPLGIEVFQPNVGVGLRTVWSDTIETGDSGGKPYGTTSETAFDLGVDVRIGADIYVGPGAIVADLGLSWVPADRFILRKTSTTALGLALGYRFML